MKVIDVYCRYFKANCVFNGVQRNAAAVRLTVTSDAGEIRYDVGVSFFPHVSDDDFAVSYDAAAEKNLYSGKGRRSRKREAELMNTALFPAAEELAEVLGGTIDLDCPLIEARLG